jgi:D-serine deaminase-like pyridoxal phosphate-dependent protein
MQGSELTPREIAATLSRKASRLEAHGVPTDEAVKAAAREHNASFHRVCVLIAEHAKADRQNGRAI